MKWPATSEVQSSAQRVLADGDIDRKKEMKRVVLVV